MTNNMSSIVPSQCFVVMSSGVVQPKIPAVARRISPSSAVAASTCSQVLKLTAKSERLILPPTSKHMGGNISSHLPSIAYATSLASGSHCISASIGNTGCRAPRQEKVVPRPRAASLQSLKEARHNGTFMSFELSVQVVCMYRCNVMEMYLQYDGTSTVVSLLLTCRISTTRTCSRPILLSSHDIEDVDSQDSKKPRPSLSCAV